MNKKHGNMPQSGFVLSIASGIIMLAAGILTVKLSPILIGGILIVFSVGVITSAVAWKISRRRNMERFVMEVSKNDNEITADILSAFPLPLVAVNIDGTIKWHNNYFGELINKSNVTGSQLNSVISGIKWGDILKTTSFFTKSVYFNEKRYELTGRLVQEHESEDSKVYSVYLYFIDKSSYDEIKRLYEDEKTDIATICIDNYDEVMQRLNDDTQEKIVSGVRKCLNLWAQSGNAVFKRLDDDRYYAIFDHSKLAKYINEHFSVIEDVRKIGEETDAPVSISIGIGSGGTLAENEQYARSAMEMTQGRGGDQVCVNTKDSFKFYGGSNKEYEKNNRVRTRAVAKALKELIGNSDKVFLMGHSNADYDCFGAAIGLQRAARELKKQPYIIMDNSSPAIAPMKKELSLIEEYNEIFIDKDTAMEYITENSLLIVLDTHRPSMLPARQLTGRTAKVVVIDHHRRSMEFVNPCALTYLEAYASSTCEMVTELMDYMDMGKKLTRKEAECLYTGMLMDTKNFLIKTGARTFSAASYLRKLGINTLEVKKLFNISKSDYENKVDIVKTAVEIAPGFAVAEAKTAYPNIRVTASQAADEMLNIGDIGASIVIYPFEDGYGICARSIGNINVQLIMEALGGGGHATVAGAQIRTKDIERVRFEIDRAVRDYLHSRNN